MPMTLNIGFHRKAGEANYGSRGASVNLEVEVEGSLVKEPNRLQDCIRHLFRMAKESVEEELNVAASAPTSSESNGNGRNGHASNGHTSNGQHREKSSRPATHSQVRAINAIADRQRVDLPDLLQSRFQTREPGDLSLGEASSLIDELKGASSNGDGGRR